MSDNQTDVSVGDNSLGLSSNLFHRAPFPSVPDSFIHFLSPPGPQQVLNFWLGLNIGGEVGRLWQWEKSQKYQFIDQRD